MSETAVTSFIIRFIQELEADNYPLNWRGVIRHVQTCEEIQFTTIEDALKFISTYVNIMDSEEKMKNEGSCRSIE